MFGVWGEIKNVQVVDQEDEVHALVTFKNYLNAFDAQQALNNFQLPNVNAALRVKWLPKETQQVRDLGMS